jgi:hypothetical protein
MLKALVFTLFMLIISYIQIANDAEKIEPFALNFSKCTFKLELSHYLNFTWFMKPVFSVLKAVNLTAPDTQSRDVIKNVFEELIEKNLLDFEARSLCLGHGSAEAVSALQELGFSSTCSTKKHPFFSLVARKFLYESDLRENYFDFVFSRDYSSVSVPALLVIEMERVLRPGGTGALLVKNPNFYSGNLIRIATPVSSFLMNSNVVSVFTFGSSSTLVIFKKRFENVDAFEHFRLPNNCPSISNNKPIMKYIEPLVDGNSVHLGNEHAYLTKFMNVSSRNRLVYINIGAGELLNSSITDTFVPNYPFAPHSLDVYVVDHNASALSSYVKKPGITFVYYPDLGEDKIARMNDPDMDDEDNEDNEDNEETEEGFDFIDWFKETKKDGDFVVLMMNAREMELKILFDLYKSGEICHVDELFIRCSDEIHCNNAICGDCSSLYKGLRSGGVFVHQCLMK